MGVNKTGLHFECSLQRLYRLVIPACIVEGRSHIPVYGQRKRVKLKSSLRLFDSIVKSPPRKKGHCIPVVSARITGIKLDGSLIFLFRALPVPIIVRRDPCQRGMRFGNRVIDLQRLQRGRSRPRIGVL